MPAPSNTSSPDDPDESPDNTTNPAALAKAIVHALTTTTSERPSEPTSQSDDSRVSETDEPVDRE